MKPPNIEIDELEVDSRANASMDACSITSVHMCMQCSSNTTVNNSKALLVNRRIMFFGGANFSDHARRANRETTFRATGQVVEEILEDATDWRAAGTSWDGRC